MLNLFGIISGFFPGYKSPQIFLNRDGSILTWNNDMEILEGYKAHEIVGKKLTAFFSSMDASPDSLEKMLNLTMKKGRSRHSGIHFRKDGTIFKGKISLSAIKDEKKEIIGFDLKTHKL
jgi:PAS domain S-box-containing protein